MHQPSQHRKENQTKVTSFYHLKGIKCTLKIASFQQPHTLYYWLKRVEIGPNTRAESWACSWHIFALDIPLPTKLKQYSNETSTEKEKNDCEKCTWYVYKQNLLSTGKNTNTWQTKIHLPPFLNLPSQQVCLHIQRNLRE